MEKCNRHLFNFVSQALIGCTAHLLSNKISQKKEDYDKFGCLIAYNSFIKYFNKKLKKSIKTLRHKHPQAKIIYFDFYNDVKRLYQEPQQYGVWINYFLSWFTLIYSCQIYLLPCTNFISVLLLIRLRFWKHVVEEVDHTILMIIYVDGRIQQFALILWN